MNLERERELCKEWFEKNYPALYRDSSNNIPVAQAIYSMAIEAWLASANREGHKLVPVSFLKDINSVAVDEFHKWKIKEEQMPVICEYMQDLSFYIGVEK